MKKILKDLIDYNPIFVLILGLCSALAVTTKFEHAYIMGICLLIVLIISNVFISLIRKIIPKNIRIPVFITIISLFVTGIEILLKNYVPAIYNAFGIYLPLLVVNCIVLGRALTVACKNDVKNSSIDAIKIGLGYTLALCVIALIRESLGNGTITLMDNISELTGYKSVIKLPESNLYMSIFTSPAGAFLTIGLLSGLVKKIKEVKNESN